MLTLDQARQRLRYKAAADSDPPLSDQELDDILAETARYGVWAPETTYAVGDRVIPATPNGRVLVCAVAGTSGAAAPTWYSSRFYGQLADGDELRWSDGGPAYPERYDLTAAAHEAWTRKAGKAAEMIATSDQGKSLQLQQMYDHCRTMAASFRPVFVR